MQTQSPFALITPTLDGDVLAVLARADTSFTVANVQRILEGRSTEGIRRVLGRLSLQGIVLTRQVGNTASYKLNREHLAAPHVIALANLRTTLRDRMREHVEAWPDPPVWAALFGSAARGQMRPDSDIDVFLVEPDSYFGRLEQQDDWEDLVNEFSTQVTNWTGNATQVMSMTTTRVNDAAQTRDPIVESLLQDSLTISGEPDWLRQAVTKAGRS